MFPGDVGHLRHCHRNGRIYAGILLVDSAGVELNNRKAPRPGVSQGVLGFLALLGEPRVCVLELVSWETRAWPGLGRDGRHK